MVGVWRFPSWAGTYLLMGWLAFLEMAHAMYLGMIKRVNAKAMRKERPARTEMYPKRLMLSSWASSYNIGDFQF